MIFSCIKKNTLRPLLAQKKFVKLLVCLWYSLVEARVLKFIARIVSALCLKFSRITSKFQCDFWKKQWLETYKLFESTSQRTKKKNFTSNQGTAHFRRNLWKKNTVKSLQDVPLRSQSTGTWSKKWGVLKTRENLTAVHFQWIVAFYVFSSF